MFKITTTVPEVYDLLKAGYLEPRVFQFAGKSFMPTECNVSGVAPQGVVFEIGYRLIEGVPITWNGEGLPPVGLEVEGRVAVGHYVGATKSEWAPCALVCASRAYVVLRRMGPGYSEDHEASHERALVEFRPIRTAKQIAAEEREQQIEKMLTTIKYAPWEAPHYKLFAEKLHDAGYRKVEQ